MVVTEDRKAVRCAAADAQGERWQTQHADAKKVSQRRYRDKVKKAATKEVVHKKPGAYRSGNPFANRHRALSYTEAPRHEEARR